MITSAQKPRIAFLASPATRAKGAPAHEFVDRLGVRLQNYKIVTTGGVYRDLFAGRNELDVEQYPPHDHGGLVMVAADIADGKCQSVLNFADPAKQQGYISYSLHNTIMNQAIWADIEYNINPKASSLWLSGATGADNLGEQTLALIAHSPTANRQPKNEIIDLAKIFAAEFSRFQRIICTGTTGKELGETVPQLRKKLFAYKSGMRGGDVQIAREIAEYRCQHVIFLINPEWAQPHRDDVLIFVELSRHFPVNIMFTTKSAWRWAGALKQQLS